MKNNILSLTQIIEFVFQNKYEFDSNAPILSRCIDGRYNESIENLEPLAKPGADIGELMMLCAANNQYALNLTYDQIYKIFIQTIGKENLRIHTDSHFCHDKDEKNQCLGCGHFKQGNLDMQAYGLTLEDIDFIYKTLIALKKQGIKNDVLEGDHLEKAVVIVNSNKYSIRSMFKSRGEVLEVFVYHKTLDDLRRKQIAQNLSSVLKNDKYDSEYLYEILTNTADEQLFETVGRLAKDLPIYKVKIDDNGEIEVEE